MLMLRVQCMLWASCCVRYWRFGFAAGQLPKASVSDDLRMRFNISHFKYLKISFTAWESKKFRNWNMAPWEHMSNFRHVTIRYIGYKTCSNPRLWQSNILSCPPTSLSTIWYWTALHCEYINPVCLCLTSKVTPGAPWWHTGAITKLWYLSA